MILAHDKTTNRCPIKWRLRVKNTLPIPPSEFRFLYMESRTEEVIIVSFVALVRPPLNGCMSKLSTYLQLSARSP